MLTSPPEKKHHAKDIFPTLKAITRLSSLTSRFVEQAGSLRQLCRLLKQSKKITEEEFDDHKQLLIKI